MRCFNHYKDDRICDMCDIKHKCISQTATLKSAVGVELWKLHEHCKYKKLSGAVEQQYAVYWVCHNREIKIEGDISRRYCNPQEACKSFILKELRKAKLKQIG